MQEDRMLKWFEWKHLPSHLQTTSQAFCQLAESLCMMTEPGPERTVALRKLLESDSDDVNRRMPPSVPRCTQGVEMAARTRPGVLARFVNMYSIFDSARVTIDDRNRWSVKEYGITSDNNDVETVLRAIRDYLEEMSFSEVIP